MIIKRINLPYDHMQRETKHIPFVLAQHILQAVHCFRRSSMVEQIGLQLWRCVSMCHRLHQHYHSRRYLKHDCEFSVNRARMGHAEQFFKMGNYLVFPQSRFVAL